MSKTKVTYKDLELFAGAGGLALGLERAGFESIALNEIDHIACETLRANRPNWNIVEEDVVSLSEKNCCELFNIRKGELDLLSGGYPCQSFSYAGNKGGLNDVRGTMFSYYAKILEQLMPKMFLAENVRGLVTHDGGKTIAKMIEVFTEIGYKVQYKIMNAWNYGVAQKRERVAIIGIRNDLASELNYEFPTPHEYKPVLRDALKDVPKSIGATYPDKKKRVFELVPPGGCWRSLPLDMQEDYLAGSFHLGGGKTGIARKISWDEPSLTLTCSPSQKQTDRCHPEEIRPFTVREYARIQSFPDDWMFSGSMNNQYKQIGNAVPVAFAKEIGSSIIRCLEGRKQMSYLSFISDENLVKHIKNTLATYNETIKAIDLKKFNSNIIDPIKLTFDSKVYEKSMEQIIVEEISRQRDKTNTNAIGYFHQNIFQYYESCEVPAHGFDVIWKKENGNKVYVELKNKHNTMNSSSSAKTYMKLSSKALEDNTCECYLVEIIAKKSQNVSWSMSLDGESVGNDRVRRVSIDKFYEMITGDPLSFYKLCEVLPSILDDIMANSEKFTVDEDTVIEELRNENPNLLKALYKLAFSTYEGF